MKFMVLVSNKFMVAVEAESACGAEHVILDKFADEINNYGVITGALAFDKEAMKSEYFFDCMMNSQTMSMDELEAKVESLVNTIKTYGEMVQETNQIDDEIDSIKAEIQRLKKIWLAKEEEKERCKKNCDDVLAKIGAKRERLNCNK